MKKFAIILLVLVLALTFVACGGNTDTTSTEDASTPAASVEDISSASSLVGQDNDAAMPDSWFSAN